MDLPFLGELVLGAGIFRNKDTHYPDTSSRPHRTNQIVHGQVWHLMTFMVMALIADTLATSIRTFAPCLLQNLIDSGVARIVHDDRSNFVDQLQWVRMAVDHHYFAGSLQTCRIGGHQANGTGTINDD